MADHVANISQMIAQQRIPWPAGGGRGGGRAGGMSSTQTIQPGMAPVGKAIGGAGGAMLGREYKDWFPTDETLRQRATQAHEIFTSYSPERQKEIINQEFFQEQIGKYRKTSPELFVDAGDAFGDEAMRGKWTFVPKTTTSRTAEATTRQEESRANIMEGVEGLTIDKAGVELRTARAQAGIKETEEEFASVMAGMTMKQIQQSILQSKQSVKESKGRTKEQARATGEAQAGEADRQALLKGEVGKIPLEKQTLEEQVRRLRVEIEAIKEGTTGAEQKREQEAETFDYKKENLRLEGELRKSQILSLQASAALDWSKAAEADTTARTKEETNLLDDAFAASQAIMADYGAGMVANPYEYSRKDSSNTQGVIVGLGVETYTKDIEGTEFTEAREDTIGLPVAMLSSRGRYMMKRTIENAYDAFVDIGGLTNSGDPRKLYEIWNRANQIFVSTSGRLVGTKTRFPELQSLFDMDAYGKLIYMRYKLHFRGSPMGEVELKDTEEVLGKFGYLTEAPKTQGWLSRFLGGKTDQTQGAGTAPQEEMVQ